MKKEYRDNEKDLATRIREAEEQHKAIKEVDKLLEEWQNLNTEEQKKRLDSLLHFGIPILYPKDRKLCINKLAEGGIISKKDAKDEVDKWVEALGVDGDEEKEDVELIHTSFTRLPDGSLAEMLYKPSCQPATFFAVYKDGEIEYKDKIKLSTKLLFPYPDNNLLRNGVIQLPSEVEEYGTESLLVQEIKQFIHKYLDIGSFEDIAVQYVLFSWLYDCFTTLPYLRALGQEEGIGKSRFLQAIGILCYKPMFCGGATTPSPIFRIIEMYKGTLIVDEADFKISQDVAEIIKIFNCGFMKGFPLLRNEKLGNNFMPRSYDVYCPKILASKREFQDKNLESRFLAKEMESTERDDIPIILPQEFWEEALSIRNKLLLWRFRKYSQAKNDLSKIDSTLEHRLNQIIVPLLSIITEPALIDKIKSVVQDYNKEMITARGMGLEGSIIEAIGDLWKESSEPIAIGRITDKVNEGLKDMDKLSSRKIGNIIRSRLRFRISGKIRGNYCIERTEANRKRLSRLVKRYGLNETDIEEDIETVDIGTS